MATADFNIVFTKNAKFAKNKEMGEQLQTVKHTYQSIRPSYCMSKLHAFNLMLEFGILLCKLLCKSDLIKRELCANVQFWRFSVSRFFFYHQSRVLNWGEPGINLIFVLQCTERLGLSIKKTNCWPDLVQWRQGGGGWTVTQLGEWDLKLKCAIL